MIPKSLSASSILVSEACMERWRVENFERAPRTSSEPANIGTSVHFALEHFVKAVYIDKTHSWDDVQTLNQFYELGYIETFNTTMTDTDAFRDGAKLVARWYDRNRDGLPNKVVSCEVKENFMVKTDAGEIPFNFIWDRADQIDDNSYEVVDYKTLRAPVRPEDLKMKIQPRAYALAAQFKWPDAKRIWVTFDMLRYEPVGVVFTVEENKDTYRAIKAAANRIIATEPEDAQETLNEECRWCCKKTTCKTLGKAVDLGMVDSLSLTEVAQKRFEISAQMDALKYAQGELDKILLNEAVHRDEVDFELGDVAVSIGSRATRKPNSSAIAHIVGPELSTKYGNFTMTNIDKMLASGELSAEMVQLVKAQISTSRSEPTPKVKPIKSFEEK